MEFHPISNIFPLLEGEDFETLKQDIATNGLIEPIWLHPDGRIIDGRNRWRACTDTNTNADFRTYTGDLFTSALISFVFSLNKERRHLTSSQLAACVVKAGELLAQLEDEAKGRQSKQAVTNSPFTSNVETIPHSSKGKSRDQAAALFGTNGRYVQDAKALAKDEPELFEQVASGQLTIPKAKQQLSGRPHVANNAGDNEWYTPEEYIRAAQGVMGQINLDPASSEVANRVVGATQYYDAEINGLDQSWAGTVWMNPPYARDLIQKFCDKLIYHYRNGDITEAITLTNNATETAWFQALSERASALCLPKGRIQFWHPEKESVPLQGQALLYLGDKPEEFIKQFERFGIVWTRILVKN
jgi:hypothetical protein